MAINYKKEDVSNRLKDLCPEGINVYCDHVGGPIAEAVYENMALFGTIAISGLLDYYSSSKRSPGPKNYDLILMKRLRVEGFFSPDFYHREKEFNPILKNWVNENKIKLPFQITKSLEKLPEAYLKLFEGGNIGKVVVEL